MKLQVSFKLLQLSWLLFVSIVLALQCCQSHLSACGFVPALRFGSDERPLPESLQRCVTVCYALIVLISFGCQVTYGIVAINISSAIRWFTLSGSHSRV